jgi:hypothetical protein
MKYLNSCYRKRTIAGHQVSYNWETAVSEFNQIKNWTNKLPAIRGFDLLADINSWGDNNAERAVAWG